MAISCCGKKIPTMLLVFVVLLPVVLFLIWFGAASLFMNKAAVEENLQKLTAELEKIGNDNAQTIKLSYGDIEIKGWGYKKQAVIHKVVLDMVSKEANPDKFKFSSDEVAVSLDPVNPKRLLVSFAKPINVVQGDYTVGDIDFSEPLLVSYVKSDVGGFSGFRYDVALPQQVGVLAPKALVENSQENANDSVMKNYIYSVTFSKTPSLQYIFIPEQKMSTVEYDFSGASITGDGKTKVSVGNWASHFNEQEGDGEGRMVGKYSLDISDIVVSVGESNSKPYSLVFNADYTADAAKSAPSAPVSEPNMSSDPSLPKKDDSIYAGSALNENREVNISRISLSSPDFNLSLSGKFASDKVDPLPFGEINISVDDVNKLLGSELLVAVDKTLAESVLTKITGAPLEGQTQLSIPVKREKMGVLFVGKTTFEELAAVLFTGMVMPQHSSGDNTNMPTLDAPPIAAPSLSGQPSSSFPPSGFSEGNSGEGADNNVVSVPTYKMDQPVSNNPEAMPAPNGAVTVSPSGDNSVTMQSPNSGATTVNPATQPPVAAPIARGQR